MSIQPTYEFFKSHWQKCVEAKKPWLFRDQTLQAVGLLDENGDDVRQDGKPAALAKNRKINPSQVNIAELSEAIFGREWKKIAGIDTNGRNALLRRMQEEAIAPIGPGFFTQIAAWQGTIGGLLGAASIEGYEQAAFDLVGMFPTRQAIIWNGGERYYNVIGPSQPAPQIGPGESHPDAREDFLWVQPAAMKKWGEKLTITKEVAEDYLIGGQAMARANDIGQSLKFRENELILDIIVGTTNNFSLGLTADSSATGYNTYGPTIGASGLVPNDITNPMTDPFSTMQESDRNLANLNHPVTGNPINVELPVVLVPTPLAKFAQWLSGVQDVTLLNQPNSTTGPWPAPGTQTFPSGASKGTNPYVGVVDPRVSRWLHQRQIASATQTDPNRSPGLGLSTANSYRWYRLNPAYFACRRVKWEPQSIPLNPNDFILADQGVVWGTVCDMAVMYQVLSPWHIQRNKVA